MDEVRRLVAPPSFIGMPSVVRPHYLKRFIRVISCAS